MKTIPSCSPSRLADYESCPLKAKLKMIDKIPEPERPLPPGKTEHSNDRGTRIHTECENFVKGTGPMPIEARKFKDELERLQKLFKEGKVAIEGEWGFSRDWQPVEWFQAWLRMKLDVLVFITPRRVLVSDYKTGASFGNQIKHGEQTQLYAAATCIRYPAIEHVTTELWYLDQDELVQTSFSREQALRFVKPFDKRLKAMTDATTFPARPNLVSCKYCAYHPVRGTGHCTEGV
jgi:RecB family exonuclease